MKKLAALLLLAAACGPGLVEFPVVPTTPGQTPGGGTPPASPATCGVTAGVVYCADTGRCETQSVLHCGSNNGAACQTCPNNWSCNVAGQCVAPTSCGAGQVVCRSASGCCPGTQIAAGGNSSCAIVTQDASTAVYCWGANDSGQLGPKGVGVGDFSGSPTEITGLGGATAAALGSGHGCAIMGDRSVMCWGKNDAGQLGSGAAQSATPVVVPGVAQANGIAVGDHHSCAISAISGVVCWGANERKQLGDAASLSLLTVATKIVAGANHTCAISSGKVICWGANESGQIGNGPAQPNGDVTTPFTVSLPGTGAVDLAAGASHTCAITSGPGIDGMNGVLCWGANAAGQIDSNNQSGPIRVSPTIMKAFNSPKIPDDLAAGRAHTCYRRGTDGACFGDNSALQLNIPATPNMGGPVAAGGDHTCYIDASIPGEIRCFGRSASGELGPFGP